MLHGSQRILVIAAWLAIGASPAVAQSDGPVAAPASPRALRIACFNTENLAAPGEDTKLTRFRFEPARRRHLERVAAVVETLAPDIIVMPEVISAAGVEAVVSLLHEKGLSDYQGHHVNGRDNFSGFDVAILSRLEPDLVDGRRIHFFAPGRQADGGPDEAWMQQEYSFEGDSGREQKKTAVLQRHAVAYFTVGGRKIALCGVHLKSNPSEISSNAQRTAETKIVREIVKRKIVPHGYLPIVLGDINDYDPDVPMADSFRTTRTTVLRDLKDYDESAAGDELVNAATFMPRVADRYTSHWDFNENGAADRDDVFTMIDHILVHRDLAPAITRAFISHAIDLDVSDHFPVVVDFRLPEAGE
jgi:endonuclease/exonuclease/phosphatase family metal-dependent hydrolase